LRCPDDGNKKHQQHDSAHREDQEPAARPGFRRKVEGPSQEETSEQSGDQATQMCHVIDVALKAKEQIQKSKPDHITEQLPYTFGLQAKFAEIEDADQGSGNAKDGTGGSGAHAHWVPAQAQERGPDSGQQVDTDQ
jgi:hypothetical protein